MSLVAILVVGAVLLLGGIGALAAWQMGYFSAQPAPAPAPAPVVKAAPVVTSEKMEPAPKADKTALRKAMVQASTRVNRSLKTVSQRYGGEVVLTLTTRPPGANVLQGRKIVGTTPARVKVARDAAGDKTVTFQFQLNGYKRAELELLPNKDRSASVTLIRRDQRNQPAGTTADSENKDGLLDPW